MVVAGEMLTANLADLGAEVIKVEPPKGDELRQIGQKKAGQSLLWKVMARNKKVIAVDLSSPDGAEIVREILRTSDVFVENFRPGRVTDFGLDYQSLKEINPKLVMVHLSGYGQTGPYSSRPGLGTLAEAFSGWSDVTGQADGPPTLPYYPLADAFAALTGYAVLAGILGRARRNGLGDEIDISLYEAILGFTGQMAIEFDQLGWVPTGAATEYWNGRHAIHSAPKTIVGLRYRVWGPRPRGFSRRLAGKIWPWIRPC